MINTGAAGPGSRAKKAKADHSARFEAVFLDPVGQTVQQRWEDAALAVAFEDLPPVSAFPAVPGRRWGPGLWWSATTGRHVAAGSNAMRIQLMMLDRDPAVTALAGRPVRLLWRNPRGQVRSWVPQLFARHADGTALLADCPSHPDAGGERSMKAADAVVQACADIGWTYRRLPPLDDVLAANLKWLAGYRHPRNAGRSGLMPAVLEAFARPRPLLEGAQATGDPIEVLPAVFHALWHGQLTANLDTPLHERAMVGLGSLRNAGAGVPASRLQEDVGEGEDGYDEETRDISETAEDAETDAGGDEAGARRGEAG
ncbi:TnsA-like heteromeric transposase endonuclease subunit [Streptomyces javensis]|uniref:TnsA-like heteromeric transposase endonuclease subunit n=1 Tax=Streptomyces javensis TaxID=114698 RepID=A0ABS0RQA4_9ACTN|nr:TnsA-like heteromeric transposase endonuclease subunit [Streptomyces javensis]MBI0319655.1 TnsA-like heteromeric transposase endonuclease subunit [Streptomyces javensis]